MLRAMTGTGNAFGLLVAGVLLVGCGGDGDTVAGESPASSSTPSSREPQPTESEDCRSTMDQANTIATELETATVEDGTAFSQFEGRLSALYKESAAVCSPRVTGDFAAALESLARVAAGYEACSFSDPMFQCDVEHDLVKATGLIHDATATSYAMN